MSHSAKYKNKKNYYKNSENNYNDENFQNSISYKRESSKKDKSRLNIEQLNLNYAPINDFVSTINTNFSQIRDIKDEYGCFRYPIKPIIEDNFKENFITKRKLAYKPCSIINNKFISFQDQNNKNIIDFSLFEDKLIFKQINKSYLQDEFSDDGADSSDEKINNGYLYLSQEIEDSFKKLSKSLQNNQRENLLSRKMRFKK